jgi:hypothetical protein
MVAVIYGLCTLTALMCAGLLLQAYRRSGYRLLLWAGLFFSVATVNNIFLMVDKLAVPSADLSVYRYGLALLGLSMLLPALIFERE